MNETRAAHIFEGEIRDRATSRRSLSTRLALNKRYQSADFHSWLHRRLNVTRGEHILDVGCGTGAQSLRFLDAVGANGTVSALDISGESVEELRRSAGGDTRLTAVVADMGNLDQVIRESFMEQAYTLAHSSYALYYSPARLEVIERMTDALTSSGRLAVFTPTTPHGMVEIAARFGSVPPAVLESLEFGPAVLEPRFRALFWEVEIHFFQSEMRVTSLNDFMSFYRATTYFDRNVEGAVEDYARAEIKSSGAVRYSKNGYLIIGCDRR